MPLGAGAVGDVHGSRQAFERHGAAQELGGIGRDRRRDLRRDDELTATQPRLEFACCAALGDPGPAMLALQNSGTEPELDRAPSPIISKSFTASTSPSTPSLRGRPSP